MNAVKAHIRRQLARLKETRRMFQIEVNREQLTLLQLALNHEIGAMQAHLGRLALAHGAGAHCVEEHRAKILRADRLYDKLVAAPFKILEAAR